MNKTDAALQVLLVMRGAAFEDVRATVFKYYVGGNLLYVHQDKDGPYINRRQLDIFSPEDKQRAYEAIVEASGSELVCAKLTKNCTGWRIRFKDEQCDRIKAIDIVIARVRKAALNGTPVDLSSTNNYVRTDSPAIVSAPVWTEYKVTPDTNERNKMNDFSLTNLKNALIDKVTHLDKKTVTILSIIALVLLVFCKYKDIKDIFNGIKKKIVNSDNFKEMVADGTSAVNSLKKIVGVKGENSEA